MSRRHDIDALRAFAFALLILYHVAMVYVADWGFHFKSTHQWEWLQWPMIFVNRWRMSLLFLLSGLAIGFAMAGAGPRRLVLERSLRLLLPLGFGMLASVPVQAYYEALSNGAVEPGFAAFMLRYLQLRPWPDGGFAGAEHGVTWNHLWYLAYLWAYSMLLALLLVVRSCMPTSRPSRASATDAGWHPWGLVLVPTVWLLAVVYWLEPRFPSTHALLDDWANHAKYLPTFLFGAFVARSPGFWKTIARHRKTMLAIALLAGSAYLALRWAGRSLAPTDLARLGDVNWALVSGALHALYLWTMLLAILGIGLKLLNRPFRWLPWTNQAIYPWYILHQSLIVPLAFHFGRLGLPGWQEFTLVLLGTVGGCALIHHFLIARVAWLRPLFGLTSGNARALRTNPPVAASRSGIGT